MSILSGNRPLLGSTLFSRVGQWNQGSIIKSIQTGSIDLNGANSNTATITAVDVSNALLLGNNYSNASVLKTSTKNFASITLTNATTVTATRTDNDAAAMPVLFTVLEFQPGIFKSIQYGNTGVSTTITAVNTAKSVVWNLGFLGALAGDTIGTEWRSIVLTNATTVTVAGAGGGALSFVVAEFY